MRPKSKENEKILRLEDGREIYDDRSIACGLFVYRTVKGKKSVLCIKRGNAVKQSGKWSVPFGYLNKDERLLDCAFREFYEETGFDIDCESIRNITRLAYIDDTPEGRKQNVSFNYTIELNSDVNYSLDAVNNLLKFDGGKPQIDTKDEVTNMEWISLDDMKSRKWAYKSDVVINVIPLLGDYTKRIINI